MSTLLVKHIYDINDNVLTFLSEYDSDWLEIKQRWEALKNIKYDALDLESLTFLENIESNCSKIKRAIPLV